MKKTRPVSSTTHTAKPVLAPPSCEWAHCELWHRVKDALNALPIHFRSDTFIEGINATDIFTLNSALGATIENQVVETLNQMRSVWDPANHYQTHAFFRQPQTFPDVIFRDMSDATAAPVMGIELKGWYLIAKEGEPSLRFTQTADACAVADLIIVVPWVLGNVISGRPKIFPAFIESARYVAQYRNYHWQHVRGTSADSGITVPGGITPYPAKSDASTDAPASDKGNNFGRIARTGIMDIYMAQITATPLCGIKSSHWLDFFKLFHQDATDQKIAADFIKLRARIEAESPVASGAGKEELLLALNALERTWFS
jgi:hypothetical protein